MIEVIVTPYRELEFLKKHPKAVLKRSIVEYLGESNKQEESYGIVYVFEIDDYSI